MSNRTRKNKLTLYLSDDERFILEEKWKLSELRSRSAFLRNLIIYGYVYDVDYKDLNEYTKQLHMIGSNLNQIRTRYMKTGNLYKQDIEDLKELMDKLWHTHESMLSKQPYTNQ